ncbi:PDC sensor domain-containing protein [Agrobacterium sp. CG674]
MDGDLGFTISRSTCSSSPLKAKSSFCQVGPQSGTGESILDPLLYIVQGKNVYLATMSVPITVNGKFAGVAGADFDLSFVQELAQSVKTGIYDGQASVEIVSHKGLVVASSRDPKSTGERFDKTDSSLSSVLTKIKAGEPAVYADDTLFRAIAPIVIGRTKTPWSVLIAVPAKVTLAKVTELDKTLVQMSSSDRTMLAGVEFHDCGLRAYTKICPSSFPSQ